MHENLKSTYSLGLRELGKNKGWQNLASNNSYGTFYTLSGKFHFEGDSNIPTACELYLQNYQGNVTIGIISINDKIQLVEDSLHDTPTYVMIVHLKALHAKNSICNSNIYIDNSNFKNINDFNKDCALKIECVFDKIEDFDINCHENSIFIDEARGLREGDEIVIPNYSNRHDFNISTHYGKYFSEKLSKTVTVRVNPNKNKSTHYNGNKTVTIGGYINESEIFDNITIIDNNDLIIGEMDILKPHPCSSNYIRFVN